MNDTPTAVIESASSTVPAPARKTLRDRLRRLADAIQHPMVVKELRQAARGKFVLRAMMLVQFAAFCFAAITLLMDQRPLEHSSVGLHIFTVAFGCGLFATCAVVPYFGFLSLGAEREMSTLDMLHLTRLRPRNIVFGKLVVCVVLALEFIASLAPVVVLAYLMPGLDLRVILAAGIGLPILSAALSAAAIGLSGLVTTRLARALLSVVLIIGLFIFGMYAFFGLFVAINFGGFVSPNQLLGALGGATVAITVPAMFLLAGTMAQLTHFEENRSLASRVIAIVTSLLVIVTVAIFAATTGIDDEGLAVATALTTSVLGIAAAFGMTEAEALPRRVAASVPRNRFLALLTVPFLPGGGRALVCFLLATTLLLVGIVTVDWRVSTPGTTSVPHRSTLFIEAGLSTVAYVIVLFGGISLLFATNNRLKPRGRLRTYLLLSPFLLLVVAVAIGFAIGGPKGAEKAAESAWNPFYMIAECADLSGGHSARFDIGFAILLVAAAVIVALNVPRVVRGIQEVLAASAARRAAR